MDIIELTLKEENKGEGITAISLVKNPAIEQSWIAFSADGREITSSKAMAFKTINEEKRIIAGPAMVPDKLIYRKDESGESFVFFSADTIRELSERFLYQGKQNNMTLEHEATLNDLSVIESWIVEDPVRDKSQVYGFSLPIGSWFVKVKVLNDDIWALVKEKQVTGFSVEGVFARDLIKTSKTMKPSKLDEYLGRIKTLFAEAVPKPEEEEEEKFGSVEGTNADGTEAVINFPGETLEPGAAVTHEVDGEQLPLPTGRWALAGGGFLIVSEEGVAGSIETEEEAESEEEMNKIEKLTEQQMEALVNGLAELLTQFKADVQSHVDESVKTATEKLRAEFNKPAAKPKPETPEKTEKSQIVKGLNQFVKEAHAEAPK
jgi:hypothetical protein